MSRSFPNLLTVSSVVRRLTLLAAVAGYVALFNMAYWTVIVSNPKYIEWGFGTTSPATGYLVVSWILSLLPALWLPLDFKRPSLLLFLVQYLVLFVPSTFILYWSGKPVLHSGEALFLISLMFIGLSIMQSVYYVPLVRIKHFRVPVIVFNSVFVAVMLLSWAYVVLLLGRNFRLADLTGIYDVRESMGKMVAELGSRLGLYAQAWLTGFFLPFTLAVGIFKKQWWIFLPIGIGYLILFGIGGNKTTLFAILPLFSVYVWLKLIDRQASLTFVLGLILVLSAGVILAVILPGPISTWYIGLVHFRTISVPPLLIGQYYEFLQHHPYTHLSHVRSIGFFIPCPYDSDIALQIGSWFYGVPVGSNAGFWAGDGLLGFGPFGIVYMSFVCAILFWVLDSLSSSYDPRFVALAMTVMTTSFLNTSLFTTLLTGGLGLLMATLLVLPKEGFMKSLVNPVALGD